MEFERSEIVSELRKAGSELAIAAADEIERLRAENFTLNQTMNYAVGLAKQVSSAKPNANAIEDFAAVIMTAMESSKDG